MNAREPTVNPPLLEAIQLEVNIGGHRICRNLDWRVDAGESWAILGRNGAGKSTLLATTAGLRSQHSGRLSVAGLALPHASAGAAARAMARVRGYLSQHQIDPFASTVMESVLVGRHPHLGRWDWESADDRRIAGAALTEVDLGGFAEREVQTLSGGERQRLAVAQLLAQEPLLYLLDEPLTHLDLSHQVAVMELFARRAAAGAAIVAVLHDPGFAARYCRQALLLFGDGECLAGAADEVITATNLTRLYGHPLRELRADGDRWFVPC
ncbi:MAG: ABC transporter ATP-binding protein [Sulfuritalea sp.]|jgi:iron complex transport system ATP-binding protein|nr:ABC transporter ATP-binding protein [Sulfuritalea sp.]